MKRILAILLAVLVLSSCTVSEQPSSQVTVTDNTQLVFKIDGELPDIGAFSGKTQKRFYDEYTPDFIPSDKYGEIIPYIGSYKSFTSKELTTIQQSYGAYGFCTPDGRIVMDASSKTVGIYYSESNDGFGYYNVSLSSEGEDVYDDFMSGESLIVPKSGEWCIKLDRGDWISSCSNGVITVCKYTDNYESMCGVFYDYNGNKLSTIETSDGAFGRYAFGMMSLSKWDKEASEACFIDLDGNIVLGPYESVSNFNKNGIAAVTDKNGDSYLIDTSGKRLTSDEYERIQYHEDYNNYAGKTGFTAYRKDGSGTDVFDENGDFIVFLDTIRYDSLEFTKNDIICYYESGGVEKWQRLSDGSKFVSNEFSVSPNEYLYGEDIYLYKDAGARTAVVFDGSGETVATLDDFYTIAAVSDNKKYLIYTSGEYDYSEGVNTLATNIYDCTSDEVIHTFNGETYSYFIGTGDRYAVVASYSSNAVFGGLHKYYLYDLEKGEVVFSDCMNISYTKIGDDGYFNICTANYCYLYDEDMNVILKTYSE